MRFVVEWNDETGRWMVWDTDRACVAYQSESKSAVRRECRRLNRTLQ